MPKPVGRAQRYMPGLDGLRAIAVLAVIAFHQGEPGFVALALEDGSELALADGGDPDAVHLHGKAVRPSAGHRFEVCVYASDVDVAVGELRAAGVPVLLEPVDQPWGERLAYVEDPEGNPVMICAPLTPEG